MNRKMKIVIAMDSFKGSMSSLEAGDAVKRGIWKAIPEADVQIKLLADGGEGTVDAILIEQSGTEIPIMVKGPMGDRIKTHYAIQEKNRTAVIEMAAAAGITLVSGEKNPLISTSYGIGEMIKDALERGCLDFIIGIGGSATNDAGIGMLLALGYQFLDDSGMAVGEGAAALSKIVEINADHVLPAIKDCRFQIACDVKNPLCGENGATYIFGSQKGVKDNQKEMIDSAMWHFADVSAKFMKREERMTAGAGAAGGIGFAFLTFLNAELVSGASLVCSISV